MKTGFTENQALLTSSFTHAYLVVRVMFSNIWQIMKIKKQRKLKQAIKSAWQQKTEQESEHSDIWDEIMKGGEMSERAASYRDEKGGEKMLTGASDGTTLSMSLWGGREQVQRGETPKS